MRSNIEIKFLTSKQMANAKDIDYRYENVDAQNLGFADSKKNRIYVRAGLDRELTNYLVNHELDHLFELEGTHEDGHGIRHKKFFKQMLMPVLTKILLPALGAVVGGPLGGMLAGGLGSAVGTGVGTMLGGVTGSSLTGKPNWAQNAISGAGAGVGSGIGGLIGGTAGKVASGAAQTGFGMIPFGSGSSKIGYNAPTMSGFGGEVAIPQNTFGRGFSMGGETAPSGYGSGAQGGGVGLMNTNVGTGQAGITLGSQGGQGTNSGRGFNDIWGRQSQNAMMNMPGFMPMAV